MPRIRKKTSNRVNINDREKLKKKVKDGKKKKAKLAKKSVQWKSKHKKDPGIPNEFPYKDQILAEVAEQRRIALEDKQRRKEEKHKMFERARAIARGEVVPDEDMEGAEEGSEDEEGSGDEAEEQQSDEEEEEAPVKSKKDLNVGADSIASLSAKQMEIKLKPRPKSKVVEEEEVEEEDIPVLINRDLPNLHAVIDKADVIIELLDARDPEAFRNKTLEDLVVKKGKKLLLILNKIDTCPKESVAQWTELLRKQHPTLLFRSATSFLPETSNAQVISSLSSKAKGKSKAKAPTNDAVGRDVVLECLSAWRKDAGKDEFNVAVVGLVNTGKSSFINSLNKRAILPVYTLATSSRGPSTTELPQEAVLEVAEQKFTFIDTPGLSFISREDDDVSLLEEFRSRDILSRSKGRIDRLKDPSPPVEHIVSRANTEDLMVLYSLPAFSKGDPTAFLSGVARANQLIKKKGELDLTGAARIVLRDWNIGKFAKYCLPPTVKNASDDASLSASGSSTASAQLQELYAKQEAVIAALTPRKELRKKIGLVKLTPSSIDTREPALEEPWAALNVNTEESDDEDADGDAMEVDEMGSDEDEEDDDVEMEDDEEEEEEEAPPPPVSASKRKRGPERAAPAPPAKKVAFTSKRANQEAAKADALKVKAAQQAAKPVQPAPAPVKSALKTKKAPAAKSSEDKPKAAANLPSAKSSKAKATTADENKKTGDPEAYDFGKFF